MKLLIRPLVAAFLALIPLLAFAQSSKQSTGTGSRDGSSGSNPFPEADRLIHFTGKVILSDTNQPAEGVPIQRLCGNSTHREGYTDARGVFNIMLGSFSSSEFQDASESGSSSDRNFNRQVKPSQLSWDCEIVVALPGYRSSTVVLAGRDLSGSPDLGTLVLQRITSGEGNSISAISLSAPDNARKEFFKGRESFDNQKFSESEKHLAKAVAIYPSFATAWEMLGRAQQQQQHPEARRSFLKAIAADDKYVPAYLELAMLESTSSNWDEVIRLTTRAIQLDPASYPEAYYLNGIANFSLSRMEEAERSARKAVELDKQHRFPRAEFLLGNVLWTKGDEAGAAEHMRTYLTLDPNCAEAGRIKSYLAKFDQPTSAAKP